ncbi:deoxyguanosinetriphosphate triphosphohydrolase [Acetobacter cibinongensis]|uniref:Deoxyguanosinetriphosphate triphosphohydrolase-like protein n=1 Tax=Acetobacter cibinongensis TaxID=146475 RepID=A0A1Z5YSX6_9PROT|nr:deoxyguanosinetriphosphate triphosphohydrolase [Acetobacter cibinongensis]OUJ01325.1 deoxyguanosinetriphosphate triphosphohydrolase [Acetobacter cibinongensis]GAN60368.1 deoxyguanosinetriphosphate triphosphohydrolase [Acetobacter cibinongensis]GBQ18719.1 deoxyguanosinetriphosphate triphosphohydrolase [Acetobacter cibinongensis NRIC 0482]GEL58072.1 deoxyguanosinetriphosphate triphosphohydrolase-like protein [Acetobacter cibinongensis]
MPIQAAHTDLASYAVQPAEGRGRRLYREEESPTRSPWQRDRDRVVHSSGFRRLQYKTQVFINHEGDFFRTRLTHSLEVAQVARSMARFLQLDEDLTEAVALAHDLGHTPFGHAGEDALAAQMQPWNGFDHNTQALRQVTVLERRYLAFDGLNLTWETLEGLAKHNGPVKKPAPWLQDFDAQWSLDLLSFASTEAQVAALADDIAYHGHDLDDGVKSGLLSLDDLVDVPLVGEVLADVRTLAAQYTDTPRKTQRVRHEIVRRVIHALATDVLITTRQNLQDLAPRTVEDVRAASAPVVAFSPGMAAANKGIRKFLFAKLYRHWRVNRMTYKAQRVTAELFTILAESPKLLPDRWQEAALAGDDATRHRAVADYVASMTDRFAMEEHRRLTDLSIAG